MSEESSPFVEKVARGIFSGRICLLIVWILLAVGASPFAYLLLFRVSGGLKHAPPGTESFAALQVIKEHFQNTSNIRYEKIVISCKKKDCPTADTSMSRGLVTQVEGYIKRFNRTHPGSVIQVQSFYDYAAHHADDIMGGNMMISNDKKSLLLQWVWTPSLIPDKDAARNFIFMMRDRVESLNDMAGENGMEMKLTGLYTLDCVLKKTLIDEIVMHEIRTIWLPFLILAYALQSPRMLLVALVPMGIELPIALGIMYFVSTETTVMLYAIEMMLMLMTSLSFDYALFLLTRYAEERRNGNSVEDSIVNMLTHVGQVVLTSGAVLIIAWASMLGLPGLFVSFSLASGTMITVCVFVQMTFVPALLGTFPFLGPPAGSESQPDSPTASLRTLGLSRVFALASPTNSRKGSRAPSPMSMASDIHNGGVDPRIKALPFMTGWRFKLGGWITRFPLNVILPVVIYSVFTPLTRRFLRNFDVSEFKFNMGHLYETQVPRGVQEWSTALEIQKDFPNSMGVLMPMLIIATSNDGSAGALTLPGFNLTSDEPIAAPAPSPAAFPSLYSFTKSFRSLRGSSDSSDGASGGDDTASTTKKPANAEINVKTQNFFDANCRMINTLIRATKGTAYELSSKDIISLTVHGTKDDGTMGCMDLWKVNMVQDNWLSTHIFLKHVSKLFEVGWNSMVSKHNHAMISMIFPTVDPFGDKAFDLARTVRDVLQVETLASQGESGTPELSFMLFSAGTAVMDLIHMTAGLLPKAFMICVVVCFSLVAFKFGSAMMPIRSVLTVLIPLTWAYGMALCVFQDGLLEGLGIPCLAPTGNAGLDWVVPVFTLTFLVGLALDYDVFLFERVREFRAEGFGNREAIQLGLSATGGTITCAGAIMALSFGGSTMLGSLPNMNQMGFVMVFSIIVDTFLVRTILVPAMLSWTPVTNYWPSKMPAPRYIEKAGYLDDDETESGDENGYTP